MTYEQVEQLEEKVKSMRARLDAARKRGQVELHVALHEMNSLLYMAEGFAATARRLADHQHGKTP